MSVRNLRYLFSPRSIAVIGASERSGSIGSAVLHNCMAGGFSGDIIPVNPKYRELAGRVCYHRVSGLQEAPDLALICSPTDTVPGIIRELGKKGTKAAVVISAMDAMDARCAAWHQAILDAARPYLLRVLGPGWMGLQVPSQKLSATMNPVLAAQGGVAFVSQSASLAAGVLDWAAAHDVGFSKFITLGTSIDVDLGDVLDYLADDIDTKSILLYAGDIMRARKFMSAARAAARVKPVLIVKAGKSRAVDNDSRIVRTDEIYDAAIRRAGMLRVSSTTDLFSAAETLAYARSLHGDRLTIISNGEGPGLLAADALLEAGGQLAEHIPIRIAADAPVERYVEVLSPALQDIKTDAVLLIHTPSATTPANDIANAITPLIAAASRNLLTCWIGGESVVTARHAMAQAGVPAYDTPEGAVRGFMQMAQYRRYQNLLMQVPSLQIDDDEAAYSSGRCIVHETLAAGKSALFGAEAKALLAAYGLPVATADLHSGGSAVQAGQLFIGVTMDPVFGPVIVLGQGQWPIAGTNNRATGLPPLNSVLARDMIATAGLETQLPADWESIQRMLVRVSHLVCNVGELKQLEISFLLTEQHDVLALDAHILLRPAGLNTLDYLAIKPYPHELEQQVAWQGTSLLIRPIQPEDGAAHLEFFSALNAEDVRFRMFTSMRELQPYQLARMTQIDYDREMAFIATRAGPDGVAETLGEARIVADPDNEQAEFAVVVRSDLKGQRLGSLLMEKLITYCRQQGIQEIIGDALSNNVRLLNMVTRLGFEATPLPGDDTTKLRLSLRAE